MQNCGLSSRFEKSKGGCLNFNLHIILPVPFHELQQLSPFFVSVEVAPFFCWISTYWYSSDMFLISVGKLKGMFTMQLSGN